MPREHLLIALLATLGCGARSELGYDERPDERCNGLDDDGDGAIDEDIPDVTCGVGACAATAPGCVAGRPGVCTPRAPRAEWCNGRDDDCDGAIDEDLDFGLVSGPHSVATEVFYPTGLEATDDGVVVAWSRSFDGDDPMPNSFLRLLDGDGVPIAPAAELLGEPVALGVGPSLAPAANGRLAAGMCRRFTANDLPSWRFVSAAGAPLGDEHRVAETTESCTTFDTAPQMVFTGQRHLFVWITSTNDLVFVESTDAEGGSPVIARLFDDATPYHADLSAPPHLAVYGDRVAVVLGLRRDEAPQESSLGVRFLDLAGSPVGDLVVLPDPGGAGYLQPRVAVAPDGTLLLVAKHRFGDGWIRARVTFDGTVVSQPALVFDDFYLRDLEPRPGGGFWGAAMREDGETPGALLRLDDAGDVAETYALPELSWNPIMAQRAGRVHLVYTAPNLFPQELRSVVYGCRE